MILVFINPLLNKLILKHVPNVFLDIFVMKSAWTNQKTVLLIITVHPMMRLLTMESAIAVIPVTVSILMVPNSDVLLGDIQIQKISGPKLSVLHALLDNTVPTLPCLVNPQPCLAGYYCPGGTAVGNEDGCTDGVNNGGYDCAIICPIGTYCTTGSFTPRMCVEGTFTRNPGSQSDDACVNCEAGYFCSREIIIDGSSVFYRGMSGFCEARYASKQRSVRSNGQLTVTGEANDCPP